VADRQIVLDANILIRATLGARVRRLVERYAAEVEFFAPDDAFTGAHRYLPGLISKRQLDPNLAMDVLDRVSAVVHELPVPFYGAREASARARIEIRDPDDWPVVACALTLGCPVWTEDLDFFGCGVATWTTDRVELFLAEET